MERFHSATRRNILSLAIAASSAAIPAAVAVAAPKTTDQEEMLFSHFRKLSPERQELLVGWAKWQVDLPA